MCNFLVPSETVVYRGAHSALYIQKLSRKSGAMIPTRRKITSTLVALALAFGSVGLSAAAANAAPPTNCSNFAGVPYKSSSGKISGNGSGSCTTAASRTLVYEIHRSEGWWHPIVATGTNTGKKTSYTASATNCDNGSGSATKQYFSESKFSGYSGATSGNTGNINICSN